MKTPEAQSVTQRALAILNRLEQAYPDLKPLLVYRNPYELLIAVILSAQTTDAQVNLVTPTLFSAFPDPCSLAAAPQQTVEELVHRTGFFRAKARNIRAAARIVCEQYDSQVPESMEQLVSLPGVGRKTANVLRGALFGLPAVIVDTHFARVTRRLGLATASTADGVEREILALVPPQRQYSFSMRVNYHGRYRCSARRPDCAGCEVRLLCPYPSEATKAQATGADASSTDATGADAGSADATNAVAGSQASELPRID